MTDPTQVASRMVSVFNNWRDYDATRGALMKAQIDRIAKAEALSANVLEIASTAIRE